MRTRPSVLAMLAVLAVSLMTTATSAQAPDDAQKTIKAALRSKRNATLVQRAVDAIQEKIAKQKDVSEAAYLDAVREGHEFLTAVISQHMKSAPIVGAYLDISEPMVTAEIPDLTTKDGLKMLSEYGAFLDSIKLKDDEIGKKIDSARELMADLKKDVDAAASTKTIIGTKAPTTPIDAWVNGAPLKAEDIKGKVVMLDFWAVWCGPCISTFPHLREWNAKYAQDGLVMVGVTRLYEYGWDAGNNRAVKKPGTKPLEEQIMLQKFAVANQMTHRLAVVTNEEYWDHFEIKGIPTCILVDRQGKVQLVVTGAGEESAKKIEAKLQELLGEKTSANE